MCRKEGEVAKKCMCSSKVSILDPPLLNTDTDKLVSIKGLVIRATPVIPDMKLG